jgi:hypothetical protein
MNSARPFPRCLKRDSSRESASPSFDLLAQTIRFARDSQGCCHSRHTKIPILKIVLVALIAMIMAAVPARAQLVDNETGTPGTAGKTPGQTGVRRPQAQFRQTKQIRLGRPAVPGDRGMLMGPQVETAETLWPRRRRPARLQAQLRRQKRMVVAGETVTKLSADPVASPPIWTVSLPVQLRHQLAPMGLSSQLGVGVVVPAWGRISRFEKPA